MAVLRQEIMNLNQEKTASVDPQMRAGFFRKLVNYFKKVVFADAVGALHGATIGSVAPGVGTVGGALIGGVASSAVAAIPAINRN